VITPLRLAFVIGILFATESTAQAPLGVRPGSRVRVALGGHTEPRIGTLTRLTADTIVVDAVSIARSDVTRFDLSVGQKSRWLRGLGLGFGAGLAIGAVIGAAHPCLDGEFTQLFCATFFGAVGAAAGAPLGAVFGSGSHTDRWRRMAPDRLVLSAGPAGRLHLGFTVSL
jgi:hypothetical protein